MTTFSYQGRTQAGESRAGRVSAPSKAAALRDLRARGIAVSELTPSSGRSRAVLREDIARDLARALSPMLDAGFPLSKALDLAITELPDQSAGLARSMQGAIERGQPPADALASYEGQTATVFASILRAGQASGQLSRALETAADTFGESVDRRSKLIGALIYPSFVVVATLATLVGFMVVVVPTLASVFEGVEDQLPASTRAIIDASAWIRAYGAPIAGMGIIAALLVFVAPEGRQFAARTADRILLSPIGLDIAAHNEFGRFSRIAALILGSGVPAAMAFETAASCVGNHVLRKRLIEASASIRLGAAPSHAIRTIARAPSTMVQFVLMGEQSGRLAEALGRASGVLASRAEVQVQRLGAIAGPAVTIALGGLVALVVVALYLGLFAIGDVVR